jgi:hypothetical protein
MNLLILHLTEGKNGCGDNIDNEENIDSEDNIDNEENIDSEHW